MHLRVPLWIALPTLPLLLACSGSDSSDQASEGGNTARGGSNAAGIASSSGGASPAKGGSASSGGNGAQSGGAVNGGSSEDGNGGSVGISGGTTGTSGGIDSGTGGAVGGHVSSGGKAAAGGSSTGGTSGSGSGGSSTGNTIINDRFWKDTSGTFIYSQGGGMLQVGDTFYWYGVKYGGAVTYAASPTGKNDDISFQGITTYSSKDLVNWKLEATDRPSGAGGWFGRLGVAYNATSKKYVLLAQGGGGLYFATSSKPNGGFVFDHVQTNLPGIANGSTGDQTVFQDDDGQAYLVSSSSSGRSNRYISPLRASDFLNAEDAVLVYRGGGREGNCMFKYNGTYYFCSSDLHGWNSSQTYCVSASNIRGPWSAEFVLKGTERDYSHVTQTGFFFNVKGSQQTTVVFAGDRWSDFGGNGLGYNQWLPLDFNGTTPHFNSHSAWTIDVSSGTWAVAPENNWILNPSFEADRVTVTTPVGWTGTGTNPTSTHSGRHAWQVSGNSSLAQNIPILPNATYTLTVWAKSSGSGATLSIKNHGSAEGSVPIPAGSSWTKVTLSGINVTSGKADVAVTSNGQTVTLDDFVLTRG